MVPNVNCKRVSTCPISRPSWYKYSTVSDGRSEESTNTVQPRITRTATYGVLLVYLKGAPGIGGGRVEAERWHRWVPRRGRISRKSHVDRGKGGVVRSTPSTVWMKIAAERTVEQVIFRSCRTEPLSLISLLLRAGMRACVHGVAFSMTPQDTYRVRGTGTWTLAAFSGLRSPCICSGTSYKRNKKKGCLTAVPMQEACVNETTDGRSQKGGGAPPKFQARGANQVAQGKYGGPKTAHTFPEWESRTERLVVLEHPWTCVGQ